MNIDIWQAFIAGVVIPLLIALFGREPIGKMLLGKEKREDTALGALVELARESVSGWRESNAAVIRLSDALGKLDDEFGDRMQVVSMNLQGQDGHLKSIDSKLDTLIRILAEEG